jgi:hypothetical protein
MTPNTNSLRVVRRLLLFFVWATALVGCTGSGSPGVPTTLELVLPNGLNATSATYIVWSSGELVLQGVKDLTAPRADLALTLLVPPGKGDILALTVTTSRGNSCTGTSPPFDVLPGVPTQVSLVLSCLAANPQGDSCPSVQAQLPSPAEANVPAGQISVTAAGSDTDPGDVLSFSWTASAGSFVDPTASSTDYVCTTAGAQTLVLQVNDNHVPTSCTETFLLPVTCLGDSGDAGTCGDACGTSGP